MTATTGTARVSSDITARSRWSCAQFREQVAEATEPTASSTIHAHSPAPRIEPLARQQGQRRDRWSPPRSRGEVLRTGQLAPGLPEAMKYPVQAKRAPTARRSPSGLHTASSADPYTTTPPTDRHGRRGDEGLGDALAEQGPGDDQDQRRYNAPTTVALATVVCFSALKNRTMCANATPPGIDRRSVRRVNRPPVT